MTIDERRKYLQIMRQRYVLAERSRLLDEMAQVTALHRKSLLRLLAGELTRQPRGRERARTYQAPVAAALRVIAESFDYLCADRLDRLWALPGATAGVTEDVHALLSAIAQPAPALL